jgi:hypothetical protein
VESAKLRRKEFFEGFGNRLAAGMGLAGEEVK